MISTIIYGFLLAVCTLVAIYFIFIFFYLIPALTFSERYRINIFNIAKESVYKVCSGEIATAKEIE